MENLTNINLGNIDVYLRYLVLIKIRFNRTRKHVSVTITGQSLHTLFISFINTDLLFMLSIFKVFIQVLILTLSLKTYLLILIY